ncbi:response regulator transcription factor [Herbivorax sp. ANBcel31]|uniref:response regulator transcription factor n=1 Tax=Herbivorax sp. ANBcel31 TaxID=3069754 RepID=UPI0027B3371C|nr:response regulator transcription factor [Herbivorax sp. ANBcel31]MDQ2087171.1 response regulator transcription factor [Herbivorax sp. ANBcel31]
MKRNKVLVVDDEERMRNMISEYFSQLGYDIDNAADGFKALEVFEKEEYSLVILDIMMPKMNGWEVLREIRQTSQVPIIMLSAKGEEYDKLFGFELGVDDYVVKPFSLKELLARSKAIIKRSFAADESKNQNQFKIEEFQIDFDSRNVIIKDKAVELTPKEYELLSFFIQNPNKVFSREHILSSVWGYDFYGDNRTVDTHVKMLRESLGEYRKFIVTVWGTGYKFEIGELK